MAKKKPINPKHKAFADAYLDTLNATAAYVEVYKVKRDSAWREGSRLLRNVEVAEYIREQLETRHMGAQEVLTRLTEQARGSLSPFIQVDGERVLFDFNNPEAQAYMHLIKKVKTKTETRYEGRGDRREPVHEQWVEVELYDAQAALVNLGRYHKLFTDKVETHNTLYVEDLEKVLDKVYGRQ